MHILTITITQVLLYEIVNLSFTFIFISRNGTEFDKKPKLSLNPSV